MTNKPECGDPVADAFVDLRSLADSFRQNDVCSDNDGSLNYGAYSDLWYAIDQVENAVLYPNGIKSDKDAAPGDEYSPEVRHGFEDAAPCKYAPERHDIHICTVHGGSMDSDTMHESEREGHGVPRCVRWANSEKSLNQLSAELAISRGKIASESTLDDQMKNALNQSSGSGDCGEKPERVNAEARSATESSIGDVDPTFLRVIANDSDVAGDDDNQTLWPETKANLLRIADESEQLQEAHAVDTALCKARFDEIERLCAEVRSLENAVPSQACCGVWMARTLYCYQCDRMENTL